MIVQIVFFPSDALDLSQAIRVDMVDLPDKITSPPIPEEIKKEITKDSAPKKPPEKPVAAPKALPEKKPKAKEDAININKAKSKQQQALNRLKASSAVEKLKQEVEKERAAEQAAQQVFKGRALSAGTALTGLDKMQSDSYLSQLDVRIKAHWSLPQWLIGKPFRTRVHIKFDETGAIIYKRVVQSSGNPTYDEYCLLAIDKASPFPRVPDKFTTVYKVDGVVIGFPD